METRSQHAPGKIILSGEYAVLFGKAGIAIPSALGVDCSYEMSDRDGSELHIRCEHDLAHPLWQDYLRSIITLCAEQEGRTDGGTLSIASKLPLGKGMGASTAAVVAVSRCLLPSATMEEIRSIEDTVNPRNSGIDFAVVWEAQPLRFSGGSIEPITFSDDDLRHAYLIDTGMPGETTAELVAWVRSRETECAPAIEEIGACTDSLLSGASLRDVFPRHHRAQAALGVIPEHVQALITRIEESGGVAKVIGAGARTGGGGMVLAVHEDRSTLEKAIAGLYPLFPL